MIDTKNMEDFVQQQIRSAVDHFVAAIIADDAWIQNLEQRIVQHVQDRITARFSNINTVPDLVDTVKDSVRTLMQQGQVPGIAEYVDQTTVNRVIDQAVQREINKSMESLVIDPEWVAKIETLVNQDMSRRVSRQLSEFDLDAVIVQQIDQGIQRWQGRLLQQFKTNGITDSASRTELTVMDGVIVAESDLIAHNIVSDTNLEVRDTLTVKNLVVKGAINTDNHSWNELALAVAAKTTENLTAQWKQSLVSEVLELAKTQGIEFSSISVGGHALVNGSTLSSAIKNTQIEQTGVLRTLTVAGETKLNNTVHVLESRTGINTPTPEMALSVWDEEVAVNIGKLSKQKAYVGTARMQNLSLGVNRTAYLDIDTDGLVTVKSFRVGRHRIGFETTVPGWSGTRGDVIFNSDPKPNTPFAWVCLGAFRWQEIRSN